MITTSDMCFSLPIWKKYAAREGFIISPNFLGVQKCPTKIWMKSTTYLFAPKLHPQNTNMFPLTKGPCQKKQGFFRANGWWITMLRFSFSPSKWPFTPWLINRGYSTNYWVFGDFAPLHFASLDPRHQPRHQSAPWRAPSTPRLSANHPPPEVNYYTLPKLNNKRPTPSKNMLGKPSWEKMKFSTSSKSIKACSNQTGNIFLRMFSLMEAVDLRIPTPLEKTSTTTLSHKTAAAFRSVGSRRSNTCPAGGLVWGKKKSNQSHGMSKGNTFTNKTLPTG